MFIYLFWERVRERECTHGCMSWDGRERMPNKVCTVGAEPYMGFDPKNHEIMT